MEREDPLFCASLAVAGRTGTLARPAALEPGARAAAAARPARCRDVSALSGYCETRAAASVAFAILMNGVTPYGARVLQDRMVSALARYPGSTPV